MPAPAPGAPIGPSRAVPPALDGVAERRQLAIGGRQFAGRRRRPSGEAPPLPRELQASGRLAVLAMVLVLGLWVLAVVVPGTTAWWQDVDRRVLEAAVSLRRDPTLAVARALDLLGSAWVWRPVRWLALAALIWLRRWRHLVVLLVALFLTETTVTIAAEVIARPRPLVVPATGWVGYAHPSAPVASLAATLTLIALTLVRAGTPRARWAVASAVFVTLLVVARVHLGVDHLTDGIIGAALGVSLPMVVVRWAVPEAVFPVTYRRGRGAHLELDDRRVTAIRTAVRDQLGGELLDVSPFGERSSGGSTPLRLLVRAVDGAVVPLFAKLNSTAHVRADRWYKLARTVLYGTLEDETRHPSVRRLVEHEDHLLALMAEAGVPCPRRIGLLEITPEREYLLVTEFLDGAVELDAATVDETIIDEGLAAIRRMWDAGLAHRDVKPGNVLVQDGHVRIVDVAFGMIRPSPWRQAVDLANMMLILALRSDAELVYQRALRWFAPEDIAEAFAATRSVTIPTQCRSSLRLLARTEGVDLVQRFAELSPPRERIALQRWNRRRVVVTASAAAAFALLLPLVLQNLTGGGFL